ncbi:MAG: sulfatase-like hydrolase/transferase, partial [Kiritimatiellaeota bacterium]|nr:sulfatase-like hydrolase/transferase [Kiritimatiellota bacterium]
GTGALAAGLPKLGYGTDAGKRVNVLLFRTDQHHAAWLGCAGHPVVKTPHLDKLAREGVRFTQAFVPVPYCSPTRAALVTGLYPSSLGIGRNIDKGDDPLALREPRQLYQHQLAALGYHCYQLGKWHLGNTDDLKCFPDSSAIEKAAHVRFNQQRRSKGEEFYDAGPRNNSSGDWACWAQQRIESLEPLLQRQLELPKDKKP